MSSINTLAPQGVPNEAELESLDPQRKKLKETCREFEAVMVSIVLKEGLGGAEEMGQTPGVEESEDYGSKTFKQFAYEQMSYCVGRTGLIGLGDHIYNSMKDRLPPLDPKKDAETQPAISSGRRIK